MAQQTVASPASLALIEKLVGFDTTSRESNLELIDFVKGYLQDLGVESLLVFDTEKRKANLYATLGPQDRPGIMLSGHTDVVPVDGQVWTTDPFTVRRDAGKLFGRGTSDMKSFIAVVLAFAPEIIARKLDTPIHLAFSYDEEIGCVGVRRLVDLLRNMPVKPAMCIVGEPTEMKVVIAHKGKKSYRAHVRGVESHSSLAPNAVNAVEYAAEAVAYLKGMARRIAAKGPFDDDFDIRHTTVHTGVMKGGTALNIVPKECSFDFEFRHLPADDPDTLFAELKSYIAETLEPEMQAIDASTGFSFEELSWIPSLDAREDEDVVTFVKSIAERNDHGKVAFGTEAGLFSKHAGIPTVICGPGSISQAHRPDEFIAQEQVVLCETFMKRLIDRLDSKVA
ncbi:MAG: acetylornithine deacetylase [Proteobacteria bacterium]|nr:acetylornithine deacetylase [Pseudomonadota bacterium]